jgi:hypothetical protein
MEPSEIVNGICRLANQIDEHSTHTTISISGLLTRKEEDLNQKIIKVNSTMKAKCRQQGWSFLPNNNINNLCLNRGGLHLNPKVLVCYIIILLNTLVNELILEIPAKI